MTIDRPVRLGLLGCGRIARYFHGPILAGLPDAALVAVADVDELGRDRIGSMVPGATRFADWRRLIETCDLDAVVICLPPRLHAPAAIAAFEAGLSVYVEKPMALDIDEADAMIAARDRASGGRMVGMVGLNFRFHPLFQAARRRREEGELGRILTVRTLFTSARRVLPGWKSEPKGGGNAIVDLGTHHFDLIPYLTGQPIDMGSISTFQTQSEHGSLAVIAARLGDGTPIQSTVAQTTGHSEHTIDLLCEKGHLTINLNDASARPIAIPPDRLARVKRVSERLRQLTPVELFHRPGSDPSFVVALSTFVDAVRGEVVDFPDLEAGRRTVAIAEAIEESSSSGSSFGSAAVEPKTEGVTV